MELRDGTSVGKKGKITRLDVSLLKSLGGEYSSNGTDWNEINYRTQDMDMNTAPDIFTGDMPLVGDGVYNEQPTIILRQSKPYPFAVRAIVAEWNPTGR